MSAPLFLALAGLAAGLLTGRWATTYCLSAGRTPECAGGQTGATFMLPMLSAVWGWWLGLRWGLDGPAWHYLALVVIVLTATATDLRCRRIPNPLIAAGAVLAVMSLGLWQVVAPVSAWLGVLVGGGALFLFAFFTKGGLGGGDVKLAAVMGLFLGWQGVWAALLVGCLVAGVAGIILVLWKIKSMKDTIPFAPFLAGGALGSLV
jgi:leader peptidase (prepilin peptidase)/N-methyltransferase